MKPIKTAACNHVYLGPTPEIGDLHCQRVQHGEIRSFWTPTPAELELLNAGGAVQLDILTEPIPPVAVNVITPAEAEPVGDHPFKQGGDEPWQGGEAQPGGTRLDWAPKLTPSSRRSLDEWALETAEAWNEHWRERPDHRYGLDFAAFLGERFLTDFNLRNIEPIGLHEGPSR